MSFAWVFALYRLELVWDLLMLGYCLVEGCLWFTLVFVFGLCMFTCLWVCVMQLFVDLGLLLWFVGYRLLV